MPREEKIAWFVVAPALWIALAFATTVVYENPLPYLFDILAVIAFASLLRRTEYTRWAKNWREVVLILWLIALASRVQTFEEINSSTAATPYFRGLFM